MKPIRLSAEGSDRATAYNFSNKILRWRDRLLVGWLDAPSRAGGATRIQLGLCDGDTGALQAVVPLGEGRDNHCGPSLLLDDDDRVHAFVGAHHGDFLHRVAQDPADPDAWSEPEALGPSHSYPVVALDGEGTLHLAYRESYRGAGETWQLEYVRKPAGGAWSAPLVLAKSPVPGYNHFMHSLSVGPTGALHVTFQFHYSTTGNARQGKSKLAAHIRSDDGGHSWTNEGAACQLPLTVDSTRPFVSVLDDPEASIRIGTHVIDADDQPWLYCAHPEPPLAAMWRRTADGWQAIPLDAGLPHLSFGGGGRSTATTRDAAGGVHLLLGTQAAGAGEGWYHPANELHHVAFAADGEIAGHAQLTEDDPARSRWLPSVEHWNWRRPADVADGAWFSFTSGVNAGWMDAADYQDDLRTEVWLGRLPAGGPS